MEIDPDICHARNTRYSNSISSKGRQLLTVGVGLELDNRNNCTESKWQDVQQLYSSMN